MHLCDVVNLSSLCGLYLHFFFCPCQFTQTIKEWHDHGTAIGICCYSFVIMGLQELRTITIQASDDVWAQMEDIMKFYHLP